MNCFCVEEQMNMKNGVAVVNLIPLAFHFPVHKGSVFFFQNEYLNFGL